MTFSTTIIKEYLGLRKTKKLNEKLEPVFNGKAQMTQNPYKTYHSLLRDDFSYANDGSIATFAQAIDDKTDENGEDKVGSIRLEKTLIEEIEQPEPIKSNADTIAVADRSWLETTFDETSRVVRNILERENGFSQSDHSSKLSPKLATYRFGNLASSHIIDYSAFLTKSPSVETSTVVPDFEAIFSSSKQIPSTTTISTIDMEILSKETLAMTRSQQSSGPTINSGLETLYEGKYSGTSSTQIVDFSSNTDMIPKNETDFQETVIFPTTDRTIISENILPFEQLPTFTVSLPEVTPKLIIFPNKKDFDTAHVGIKLSPVFDETDRSSEKKTIMLSSAMTLMENVTEAKINSENRTLYFGPKYPVDSIVVGDREILDEEKLQTEASSVLIMPHIAVGEQISGMQETHPSDSSESAEKQLMITSLRRQDNSTTESTLSSPVFLMESAKTIEQTQLNEFSHSGFSSRDEIILPDHVNREEKIASSDIFIIPEQDSGSFESDYIESIDAIPNIDAPFAESGTEQGTSGILKSEFMEPRLINNEANKSGRSENRKTKSDFRVSQTKLPSAAIRDTSVIKVNESIYCDIVAINEDKCPIVNDKSDQTQSDILFLIDASNNITRKHFQQAVKLVMDTVEQFKNIGPDGVQFTREVVLEFSFRKHNCKPCLLADIGDTEYINDLNSTDNVIHKVVKYGFSKQRGDRDEVPNILVVVSSGISDGQFHEALKLLNSNDITVIVISIEETNPQLIKELIKDEGHHNLFFNVTKVDSHQLVGHLVEHIRTIARGPSISYNSIMLIFKMQ
uniref:VWFA domain-containing protein n=1 Tax=Loa loa TaxID=7209 RepID=A0A1I7VVB2_LOALO